MSRDNVRREKSSKTRKTQNQNGKRPNLPRMKITNSNVNEWNSQKMKKIEKTTSERMKMNNVEETS